MKANAIICGVLLLWSGVILSGWMGTESCAAPGPAGDPRANPATQLKRNGTVESQFKEKKPGELFPTEMASREWARFRADGFSEPVCGVIYRASDPVTCGMPLGGIDTGCLDLETSGLLGYSTIFDTHMPRGGPLNSPVLGLSTGGKTWLLCQNRPKTYETRKDGAKGVTEVPVELVRAGLRQEGVQTAREIYYWGHYPVADLEFETDAPIGVAVRAWSPFLPGDVKSSMLPGSVFEVRLRNATAIAQQGTLAFSFPGPAASEAGTNGSTRQEIAGAFEGVLVRAGQISYALGVIGSERRPRAGEALGVSGPAWAAIARELPPVGPGGAGASVAVDFSLAPSERKVVRFALTWHSPTWKGGGHNGSRSGSVYSHMYAKDYPRAETTAHLLAERHALLLKRVLAWQAVVYGERSLPGWLQDSLINVLHMITEDGMWAQAKAPVPGWVKSEDGLFGLNESPRFCSQIECIPCSFYGNLPLVYFFPELALSTLRGYKGYQYEDGAPPWTWNKGKPGGGPVEFARPNRGLQFASNGISLASLIHRYLLCYDTADHPSLKEFYPATKKCMIWTMGLRTTPSYSAGDRVIAMPNPDSDELTKPPTEWFEAPSPGWAGVTSHVGGLHLAQLRITQRMAEQAGDREFAQRCEEWIQAGAKAMEERLWTGSYYLNFLEPDTSRKSELVFAYQLDGEWIARHHGLARVLPRERVLRTLETIKACNVAIGKAAGPVNYANADGTAAKVGGYGSHSVFVPEVVMLAMNYIYEGQPELGLSLAERCWRNLVCRWGYTWDQPDMLGGDADTGARGLGWDYYQNMMLWSLPAALAGQDLSGPCRKGGLVERVLAAARGGA